MIEVLLDRLVRHLSFARRWDGKNVSAKGTLRASFRVTDGRQLGLTLRWAQYSTAIAEGHLWVGRSWVPVHAVDPATSRKPGLGEAMSLDADAVVVTVKTRAGATIEWGLRGDQLAKALRLLSP